MIPTVETIKVSGKRVLVRVDFNVPLKGGVITDDNRIQEALPTIKYLISKNAKVILFSHLGKVNHKDEAKLEEDKKKNNLSTVAVRLSEILGKPVVFSPITRGEELDKAVAELKEGGVLLIQNTRYEKGEEKNDPTLSEYWASLADAYVMDAFGSAHRAHASTYGVPEILKKEGKEVAIGYLVEKEVKALSECVTPTKHPYVAILGGAKVSDKIKVIEKLLTKADKILVGGAMAYTFLKALGHDIGDSLLEADMVDFAKKCYESGKIVLPVDHVVGDSIDAPSVVKTTKDVAITASLKGFDIGPKTIKAFASEIAKAKIIFLNGPVGVFEKEEYAKGTKEVLKAIAKNKTAFSVIGGGDSAAAVKILNFKKEEFSHISTGGGASLEIIENDNHLPGIDVIGAL